MKESKIYCVLLPSGRGAYHYDVVRVEPYRGDLLLHLADGGQVGYAQGEWARYYPTTQEAIEVAAEFWSRVARAGSK